MSKIDIDYAEVYKASIVIHSCNEDLNNIIMDIRNRVNDLDSSWECKAASKLHEYSNNLYSKFENCRGIIHSYEDYLKKTVESYRQTESKNTTNASAFD